jgi:hypothetical protein
MKVNKVFALISLAIAILAGYGFFSWNEGEPYQMLMTTCSGIMFFLTLGGCIALSTEERGSGGNIRVLSVVFLVIAIISNIIFSIVSLSRPASYIIVNGIILLVFVLIAYSVYRATKAS